jgi:hypothetical protein
MGNPVPPAAEDTCRIRPPPCRLMTGITAWVTQSAPKKFVSICSRASLSVVSSIAACRP